MDDRDEELADAIRDLARTINDLGDELEPRRRSRLRPPTPRDVLRLTDEVAIPATLTMLQASVRALETFQRGIRLLRTEQEVRDRTASAAAETERRADSLRRTTVSQLDTALAELQRAVSTGSLPADDRVRNLLDEARTLRDQVDRKLADVAEDSAGGASDDRNATPSTGYTIEIEDGDDDPNRSDGEDTQRTNARDEPDQSNVDVDAELETLKDRYGPDDDGDGGDDEKGTDSKRGNGDEKSDDGNGGVEADDRESGDEEAPGDVSGNENE